jgi:hypothetical protein
MNHKQREECINKHLKICETIRLGKGLEYSNSDEEANQNFYSDIDVGVSPLQSVSVFMNKHYRSIRSYIRIGEIKSDETIEGRLHDLINYALITLSILEDENTKKH